jgi:hypothetical protein
LPGRARARLRRAPIPRPEALPGLAIGAWTGPALHELV